MKTILVPTDFSECSMYSLRYAASLARKTKASLHILNIIEKSDYYYAGDAMIAPPVDLLMIDEYVKAMKKISTEKLNKLISGKFLSRLKVTSHIITGKRVYYEIINYSNKIKADIIIMGTKGLGGIKGILFGSNAERTVRFSERPVLVINKEIINPVLKTIVFASDFTKEAHVIFPIIKNFAEIYDADIHLLKVNIAEQFTTTRDNIRLMKSFNEKFNSNNKIVIYDDYMKEEGILNYADDVNADLIAVGTHGKNGLARFFKSDVSEAMVRLTHKPILVINFSELKHKSDLLDGSAKSYVNESGKLSIRGQNKKKKKVYDSDYFDY
jgi:nucleotide-binding universal stress UspA family protein